MEASSTDAPRFSREERADGRTPVAAQDLTFVPTPVADPGPLGLAAFALTTFILSMFNANLVGAGGEPAWLGGVRWGGVGHAPNLPVEGRRGGRGNRCPGGAIRYAVGVGARTTPRTAMTHSARRCPASCIGEELGSKTTWDVPSRSRRSMKTMPP